MAALITRVRAVCTLLQPSLTVRTSNRGVRRRQPAACSEVQKLSKSEAKDSHKYDSLSSVPTSFMDETKSSGSLHQHATSKETNAGFPSRSTYLHQKDGLRFEKAHPDDKVLLRLINLAHSKKLRQQQGKIILEGRRLICDALKAGAIPLSIFFSTEERLQELPLNKLNQAHLVKVKLEDIRIWPDNDVPVDMIAIFRRPETSKVWKTNKIYGRNLPLTLICNNLRDPGNLGAMLRCAAAAGCHSVLLSTGCVDVWEPKVLRSAMGSHFHLPIIPNLTWAEIHTHLPATTVVHIADCRGTTVKTELSVTSQQQRKPGDYGWFSTRQKSRRMQYYDDDGVSDDEDYTENGSSPILETQSYDMTWVGGHTAIVIGGETHGVSQQALKLAERTAGRRLLVPMVRGVDSLNSAMAASVLLFEGRKQMLLKTESERTQLSRTNS